MNVSDFLPTRRQMLQQVACGFGSIAMADLLHAQGDKDASKDLKVPGGVESIVPHHAPKAKRVIFLFMQGGPSHVDTFDYKERLFKEDKKLLKFRVARSRKITPEKVMKPLWDFNRYGETGQWVSDLFPHMAQHVDDLCFIHSMHTNGVAHGPATLFLHTGATNLVRPSMGSWVIYGLGSENKNLPGFMTIQPSMGNGGPRNYSHGFLPARVQGTPIGRAGQPVQQVGINNLNNDLIPPELQNHQRDLLRSLNSVQSGSEMTDRVEAVIKSFELAFRMQTHAPGLTDLGSESQSTLESYGIGQKETEVFGRQCLMARRMAEAGVRFIQVNYADNGDNPRWDQHSNMPLHMKHAKAVDKPVAGLLQDLKARGLLEDTLVWWGGEFGRNPFAQNKGTGRDHNPDGFTIWLAGGGVKAGFAHGETDEYGHTAVINRVHMHDLHATVLHLLGLDHERLTYRYAGRDFRLTDVHGHVVQDVMA